MIVQKQNVFFLFVSHLLWTAEGFYATINRCSKVTNQMTSCSSTTSNFSRNHLAIDRIARALSLQSTTSETQLEDIVQDFSQCFKSCLNEITKCSKVKLAIVGEPSNRLGLVATEVISKSDVALSIPFDDRFELLGTTDLFQGYLPDSYSSWTGESGAIALRILNEVALCANAGISVPNRPVSVRNLMRAWVSALPSPNEMNHNPLLWSEDDQEVLQSSSTNKIYKLLDDIEEDAIWLTQNLFEKDRNTFPDTVSLNGKTIPCFNVEGFKWAIALSRSRSIFLDGKLRLIPILDMCNHSDDGEEVRDGYMGTFGTIKGAQLVASKACNIGDELFCSYGPKSAADYLLEYGFCPDQCWKAAVSEITIELDPDDRFYDDKLDILEFETYDQAPMGPVQSFDVISAPGRDGEPDKAMIQFARLCALGSTDAFLLESVFRQECWGFMEFPVSEKNEFDVITLIAALCQNALSDFNECPSGGPPICAKLRESESMALRRTMEYLLREKEALDLKEYYQERRLKELGLDSSWSPEDDMGSDREFGQTRTPGGADYDW